METQNGMEEDRHDSARERRDHEKIIYLVNHSALFFLIPDVFFLLRTKLITIK